MLDLTEVVSKRRFFVTGENTFFQNGYRSGFYIEVKNFHHRKMIG